jgi:hypothetical protein
MQLLVGADPLQLPAPETLTIPVIEPAVVDVTFHATEND